MESAQGILIVACRAPLNTCRGRAVGLLHDRYLGVPNGLERRSADINGFLQDDFRFV